ncbi:MAG: YbaN family protein [Methanomassiliicoccaceae archaeon]|nr:YbaN family protein [Methanomassiliicoccaceae archaeon]
MKIRNVLFCIAGTAMLVLGAIGAFLPLLPTTPLVLGAALCYATGSPRLYKWLTNTRFFGPIIKNYREGTGVPVKTKIFALASLWGMLVLSMLMTYDALLTVLLSIVGICVTIHIVRMKGCIKIEAESDPDDGVQEYTTEEIGS